MHDKVFIDTNILIYAYSIDELSKRSLVEELFEENDTIIISTQTVNEFFNAMTKKKKLDYNQVSAVIQELPSLFLISTINIEIIKIAIEISKKYKYSYFDSLMIAAALHSNCSILYSEDMHHLQIIENSLQIINPFKHSL